MGCTASVESGAAVHPVKNHTDTKNHADTKVTVPALDAPTCEDASKICEALPRHSAHLKQDEIFSSAEDQAVLMAVDKFLCADRESTEDRSPSSAADSTKDPSYSSFLCSENEDPLLSTDLALREESEVFSGSRQASKTNLSALQASPRLIFQNAMELDGWKSEACELCEVYSQKGMKLERAQVTTRNGGVFAVHYGFTRHGVSFNDIPKEVHDFPLKVKFVFREYAQMSTALCQCLSQLQDLNLGVRAAAAAALSKNAMPGDVRVLHAIDEVMQRSDPSIKCTAWVALVQMDPTARDEAVTSIYAYLSGCHVLRFRSDNDLKYWKRRILDWVQAQEEQEQVLYKASLCDGVGCTYPLDFDQEVAQGRSVVSGFHDYDFESALLAFPVQVKLVFQDYRAPKIVSAALDALHALKVDQSEVMTQLVSLVTDGPACVVNAAVEALIARKMDKSAIKAQLRQRLEDKNKNVVIAARAGLEQLGPDTYEENVNALLPFLDKSHGFEVRLDAVNTLATIAKRGDTRVIQAIEPLLKEFERSGGVDDRFLLREAAVRALATVALRGDAVVSSIGECLRDPFSEVRRAAWDALEHMAEEGDTRLIASIKPLLKFETGKSDCEERLRAIHALARVGAKGDQEVIEVIKPLLADRDTDVMSAAVDALVDLDADATSIVEQLTQRLQDEHKLVFSSCDDMTDWKTKAIEQAKALKVKGRTLGEATAIDSLGQRTAVQFTLAYGSVQGFEDLCFAHEPPAFPVELTLNFRDSNSGINCIAWAALVQLNALERDQAVANINECLNDPSSAVRKAAVTALSKIAIGGDYSALELIKAALQDESTRVRQEAEKALDMIAQHEDQFAIEWVASI